MKKLSIDSDEYKSLESSVIYALNQIPLHNKEQRFKVFCILFTHVITELRKELGLKNLIRLFQYLLSKQKKRPTAKLYKFECKNS